jgi:hypothetical protein
VLWNRAWNFCTIIPVECKWNLGEIMGDGGLAAMLWSKCNELPKKQMACCSTVALCLHFLAEDIIT